VRPPRRNRRSSRVLVALQPTAPVAATLAHAVDEHSHEHGHVHNDEVRAASAPVAGWGAPDPTVAPPADTGTPAPLPPQATPLLHHAENDPGLRATVLPQEARLTLASSDGNLALHVRVKDGQAEVRIGGSLAPMFETRATEVKAALATEGLDLARFALDQEARADPAPPERIEESALARSDDPAGSDDEQPAGRGRRHIHVTA